MPTSINRISRCVESASYLRGNRMRAISAKTGCARWQLTIDDGDVQKIRMGRVLFDDFR
jgi:hypothetical protein